MAKATILFADNEPDFLQTRSEFLEQNDYEVVQVTNLDQAHNALEQGVIDLVIMDIRMVDDDDEKDVSGLEFARNMRQSIPIIMLTSYPSIEYVREALKVQLDGLPVATDFLSKQEGRQALLYSIRKALGPGSKWLQIVKNAISGTDEELKEDYDNAQSQSKAYFVASYISAVIGMLLIFMGIALVYWKGLEIGVASSIGGIVTEAVSYLFFTRADTVNNRMDYYHRERIAGHRFETLLQACEALNIEQNRERCQEQLIISAAEKWLSLSNNNE